MPHNLADTLKAIGCSTFGSSLCDQTRRHSNQAAKKLLAQDFEQGLWPKHGGCCRRVSAHRQQRFQQCCGIDMHGRGRAIERLARWNPTALGRISQDVDRPATDNGPYQAVESTLFGCFTLSMTRAV